MSFQKFNSVVVNRDGNTYVFVTRGRSKKFTKEEVEEFFSEPQEKPGKTGYLVPDSLKKIFAIDLRYGPEFCAQKYACTVEEVMANARRLLPGRDLDIYVGDN